MSPEGIVVMVLLAYTIFTTTLVLQRKQAARGLALGLASLTVPLIPLLLLSQLIVEAVFVAALSLRCSAGSFAARCVRTSTSRDPGRVRADATMRGTASGDGALHHARARGDDRAVRRYALAAQASVGAPLPGHAGLRYLKPRHPSIEATT